MDLDQFDQQRQLWQQPSHEVVQCSIDVHDDWGPIVARTCLRGFDFTLLFEEAILTIAPLVIAAIFAGLRILSLRHAQAKARMGWLFYSKLSFYLLYIGLQVTLLIFWSSTKAPTTRLTIPTATLTIVGFSIFLVTSCLDHVRSVQPSTVLTLYLGLSALLDLARTRTLWHIEGSQTVAGIGLSALLAKVMLLAVELVEKRHLFLPKWKDTSPEDASGAINRAFFLWLNSLFAKGYRAVLTVDSLPSLDSEILTATRPASLIEKWERANKSSKDALLWVFVRHYKWAFLSGVLPRLLFSAFSFAEPFLIERILSFTQKPPSEDRQNIAYGLIAAYTIVHIGKAVFFTLYEHKTYRALTLFRGSLVTFIFGKTLRLNSTDIADAEAITLMSADIDRIGGSMHIIHDVYSSFLDLAVSMALLYRLIGEAMFAPAVWVLACLVIGMPIATAAGNAQVPWLEAIEERLAVTTKMLGSMKAIKMTGLTNVISSIVANLRRLEIRASKRQRIFSVIETGASYMSSAFAPVIGFSVYTILSQYRGGPPLTEAVAFAALGLFQLQEQPLISIVNGVEQIQTIVNSFRRIQDHLESAERVDPRIAPDPKTPITSGFYTEEQTTDETTLAATNPIRSRGLDDSKVAIAIQEASAGYSSKSDVLKSLSFEVARGKTTMIIGPVGSGKSTLLKLLLGEMPRTTGAVVTAFTKSAFCPQSPWITWGTIRQNILGMSQWDSSWYKTVTRACSLGTDFEELPDGDQTKTGTRGSRLSGGQQMRVSFARALYSRHQLMILDDVLTGLDRATERSILDSAFGAEGVIKQLGSTVVLATNSASHLHYADHIVVLSEDGTIAEQGTLEEVSSPGGYVQKVAGLPPPSTSRPELELSEETLEELELPNEDEEADSSRKAGDLQVYNYYIQIAGPWIFWFYIVACAAFIFGLSFPSIWLQWWTDANAVHPNDRVGFWLGVYAALAALAITGCVLSDWVFRMILLPKTSRRFHELLLGTTMHANTAFLTSTDAGHTTNRFSQDLQLIDHDLPQALDQTVINVFSVVVSSVMVFMGSGYAATSIPVCAFLLLFIQFFYLRTSRQLRLLDIEAKAPLFSQFLETLSGVSCIRAYGWTEGYIIRGHQVLDDSQRPYYFMWVIQRWLTLVLELMVGGIGILLVSFATTIPNGSTAYLGVALFNVMDFSSTLEALVSQWTMLETALGAISRIRSFVLDTKSEDLPSEKDDVPPNWPSNGAVAFDSISASYESSTEPVLKKINITFEPGQKVALCGRTGSGKSSLISTVLRMLELEEGSIIIDGIDISKIPRQEVRERLNTLPQEPFFLRGTVRENADPLGVASDEQIIEGLKAARLWESLEENGGLDGELSEEMLSHGQRQLFCLVRAVVKPGKIVIMDEATSSVDSETDELIQGIIRKEFSDRTLIVIAHKLHTILDFDRVALLDKGQVVEWGSPQELLGAPASSFRALYESMGKAEM